MASNKDGTPQTPQEMEDSTEQDRVRTLTERGEQHYEDKREHHKDRVEKAWTRFQETLNRISNCGINDANDLELELQQNYQGYNKTCLEFFDFLKRERTTESMKEWRIFEQSCANCEKIFKAAVTQIKIIKNVDAKSVASSSSRKLRATIKLEEVQAKLKLAEEEASIQKKKAEIQHKKEEEQLNAELSVLKLKKEAVEVEAEVKAASIYDEDERPPSLAIPVDQTRTERYISEHFSHQSENVIQPRTVNPVPNQHNSEDRTEPYIAEHFSRQPDNVIQPRTMNPVPIQNNSVYRTVPVVHEHSVIPNHDNKVASELTSFLLKKDLLMTRLSTFDEKPENYSAWKTNFRSIMFELHVSPSEEMDLLIRWLGPDSARHAKTIRSSLGSDPSQGVKRIWERMDERFGAPEMVEASIKHKLNSFPRLGNKENKKLYDLVDIMIEIESLMGNPHYSTLLSYFNSSSGVSPIIHKLPFNLQEKWKTRAANYKRQHNVSYPPFSFALDFVRELSRIRNDPAFFHIETQTTTGKPSTTSRMTTDQRSVIVRKTDVHTNTSGPPDKVCPIHLSDHSLNQCREFSRWDMKKRKDLLKKKGICFKCCASNNHLMKNCKHPIQCEKCDSELHPTALHVTESNTRRTTFNSSETANNYGGEGTEVSSKCTTLCGFVNGGRSCAKIVLAKVFPTDRPQDAVTVYVLLDDQSNHTLARSELLNQLGVTSDPIPYRLKSCAGVTEASGRRAVGFCIQSMDGLAYHKLPPIIECNDIPDNVMEIPTPEVARAHPHLRHIANELPPLRKDVSIQLLIGRDLVDVHQVQGQVTGPSASPFAQKLSLGWVIIGDVCLDGRHKPSDLSVLKTNIQHDGRGTIFTPCQNSLHVKVQGPLNNGSSQTLDFKGDSVFYTDRHDNKIGNSVEDREFLSMMDQTFHMDSRGNWTSPLPFKNTRPTLTNNKAQVFRRAINLDNSLKRNPEKLKQMCEFMENIFNTGAAERAPEIPNGHECWYIPIFAVTHPKKPGKVRAVFDSSIVHQGCSLNDALLSGPNLTNNLLGILLRFRKDSCAIAGDIQQMFYRFFVNERDRDYLRFYWYEDNDPHCKMIEYRMTVHVFGNRPSPAVATYGLRHAVRDADTEVVSFVNQDFYVDDALTSRPTPVEVIDLMRRTQKALDKEGKIRLHKIVSNVQEVLDAFPPDDLGKDIKDFSIGDDDNLVQHSLGLAWNLSSDCFIFQKPDADVPFTRRGILSKVNSIFDPIGFLSPLTICGKMILREMCTRSPSWDDPLPEEHRDRWESWSMSLDQLSTLRIPRMFVPSSLSLAPDPQVLIFSDASETAIAAAAYLKVNHYIGFIMGKSKLAPSAGHSIPRLELCGAVLATEIGEFVSDHLSIPTSSIRYFTDSKVVLGYIRNRTRRFYNYVSNRIVRIHAVSTPSQWNYVPTHLNPADAATRGSVSDMRNMLDTWLTGPEQFYSKDLAEIGPEVDYPLVSPDEDKDIRPEVSAFKADLSENLTPMEDRFAKFSTWDSLLSALSTLRHVSASYRGSNDCTGWHLCQNTKHESELKDTEHFILRCVQRQAFKAELEAIEGKHNLPRNSRIQDLSPYIDDVGLLRVGGRLNNLQGSGLASLNPVIVPNGHVATLLVRFFHNKVFHQGRAITEGAVRSHGFWILGGKRLISSIIYSCVVCRKLRRTPQEQKMADLPLDRLTPGPPFTSVGLDVFGPWPVVTRKTRGGSAQSKRWAVLFSCLTTRAVHIEVIEDMSSSCFINALRRFVALRGPVKLFRSDKGTNFIGAVNDLNVNAVNVEDKMVQTYLKDSRATWLFNAPHASHMGGVWERAIGSARKILDSMLLLEGPKDLTHEVLVTLMAEVCAILNSRPIAAIDTDPSSPMVLSPNILLTQKQGEIGTISDHLSIKDMYSASWKHVQVLSDMFWKKWRATYLESLQRRRKWCSSKQNLKTGDIVLLREKDVHRNMWPLGIVERPIESNDRLVRKAVIRVVKDGKVTTYTRPIAEMVLLLE